MARVTALRPHAGDRVVVELDGAEWRVLPADALVRAGISTGSELDRNRLEALERELRKGQALKVAARALASRDVPAAQLRRQLEHAGIASSERDAAIAAAHGAGWLDDARFAHNRARTLVERDAGDALIRLDLERRGVEPALVEEVLAGLAPEQERAAAVVRGRGRGVGTARYLARKGFSDDAIEAARAVEIAHEP